MGRSAGQRRIPFALLWPAGLVVLVGVLAFFQYRWLGQVSESERDRLRTTLNQRAREFAEDFDRDISRAYGALTVTEDAVKNQQWGDFAKRYEEWKAGARYPQIIRNIYVTDEPGVNEVLRQFDPGAHTFIEAEWPEHLAPVRDRIRPHTAPLEGAPGVNGALRLVTLASSGSSIVPSIPALLIPIQATPRVPTSSAVREMLQFRIGSAYVVLELDKAFMMNTLLPDLVARHFGTDDYRVAITDVRTPSTILFTRGLASGASIRDKEADASTSFFSVRPESVREFFSSSRPIVVSGSAVQSSPSRLSQDAKGGFSIVVQQDRTNFEAATTRAASVIYGAGAWQIALQHPAGSLEAAVSRARVRNLSLSFGVLAILTIGVFMISINAQRAKTLAAQQMDFVATVTHELRTPLAVIRSAAQNLSAGVVHEPAQAKRYGELIDAEGRRLTEMVEQVLTYAGLSDANRTITKTPTDIAWVTKDVVESCDGLIREAGFTVDVAVADNVSEVSIDDAAYRRALSNLIVNALKYGSDGRWLGVNVSMAAGKSGRPEVQVSVSDRGRGIEAKELPHIFDAFYRGEYAKERQIHGNGLGLSLVKGIAEAHGGRVTVTSTMGQGATFALYLPA